MNNSRNKIVFASDFHLGIDTDHTSKERELRIVDWLMSLRYEMKELFLVGDIFDYWFEYKTSIPKGFSDFLSALKILRNDGVKIHFFTGNHDMWMFRYFEEEYGIEVHREPKEFYFDDKTFFVGHGDGLGPGDLSYKIVKKLFSSKTAQWLFSILHPTLALGIMKLISQRDAQKYSRPDTFQAEQEWLIQFARSHNSEAIRKINYFVFGHRHLMYQHELDERSTVVNLGDWINFDSYAIWDGENLDLKSFKK